MVLQRYTFAGLFVAAVHGIWGFGVWAGLDRIAKLILEKGRF